LRQVVLSRLQNVTLVLDNPHDPHNGSAIIRSCDAFGIQNLHVLCEREPFLASRNVAKGTHQWVDVYEHTEAKSLASSLRNRGYQLVITHPEGRLDLEQLSDISRLALVLGNEHEGVGTALTDEADDTVRIGMRGFVESLNVSVSAALCLHAATRKREGDLPLSERDQLYARWLRSSVPRADEILAALRPA
jgi:tRNA (guanosine-2'-O-)-methyltransferase